MISCAKSTSGTINEHEPQNRVLQFQVKQHSSKMIKKGNNHSPVQVNLGKYDYNVWVYSSSSMGNDGVIRHHYKTFRQRYVRYCDAVNAGWGYINSRETQQAWRGSIRSFDAATA